MRVAPAHAAPQPLGGDHRLLLSFVEDGAIVHKAWFEAGARWDRFADGDDGSGMVTAAFRYGRDVEAGLIAGVRHRSRDAGAVLYGSTVAESFSATGLWDLLVYGKYRVLRSPIELAVGAALVIPLAHGDSGLTSGALQGEGFAALRKSFTRGSLIGHAGIATAGAARQGSEADGRSAIAAGVGGLIPMAPLWVFIAEVDYDGAGFEGDGSSTRGLVGVDWRPTENVVARGGVAAGLSDGAPNIVALVSMAFGF